MDTLALVILGFVGVLALGSVVGGLIAAFTQRDHSTDHFVDDECSPLLLLLPMQEGNTLP